MNANQTRPAWINGGDARCATLPAPPRKVHRIILLGAPGVGKGTQAELLSQRLGACHLSTGDVFRATKEVLELERSPAINKALTEMARGGLVADETVLEIVRERSGCLRCRGGMLLDGFPRTLVQAEALEQVLAWEKSPLTAVVNYDLPIDRIVARLSGRRTCGDCKAVFQVTTRPPRVEGICDHCGGKLLQREDDRPEAVRIRMEAYQNSTRPLIDYYQQRGLLITVAAEGTPEDICMRTMNALQK